jgi:hypothetical protein
MCSLFPWQHGISFLFYFHFFFSLDLEKKLTKQLDNPDCVDIIAQSLNCLATSLNQRNSDACKTATVNQQPTAATLSAAFEKISTIDSLTVKEEEDDAHWPVVGFFGSEWPS